jgi:hypothetical protein
LSERHDTPSLEPRVPARAPTVDAFTQLDADDLREELQKAKRLLTWTRLAPATAGRDREIQKRERDIDRIRTQIRKGSHSHNFLSIGTPNLSRRKRSTSQRKAKPIPRRRGSRTPVPEVAARRSIVKRNPGVPAIGLCELFDADKIPLPRQQREAGTWVRAYRTRAHRHAIETLIYRDRRSVEKAKN